MSATELEVETHDDDDEHDDENGKEAGEEEVLTCDEFLEVETHKDEILPSEEKVTKSRSKEEKAENPKAEPLGSYMDQTDTFQVDGKEALPAEAFQSDDDQQKGAHKERGWYLEVYDRSC